jgi:DNA-binding NtrC family response regulator
MIVIMTANGNDITKRILVLDNEAGALAGLGEVFAEECGPTGRVETVTNSSELIARVSSDEFLDLVILDYDLGDGARDGLAVLADIRTVNADLPVIVVAERGDVDIVNRAVAAGATDFLVRGQRLHERVSTQLRKIRNILRLIEKSRSLGRQALRAAEEERERYRIVGASPQIRLVITQIERVAPVPRPVLIMGERGTGKELVARAIHTAGATPNRPFVVVNCAAFPDTILESELFGHERGAFTSADARAQGKFEQADGGTLFLDEIGNMSLPFQQKVLRVIEYGAFTRVGGRDEIHVNVRTIAATNANLDARMARGEFLHDLYDRLAFEVIRVPALREREGDIELLAAHFLLEFIQEVPAFHGKRLSPPALASLKRYSFPGNVRELKNIIERAVYRDTADELMPDDLELRSDSPDSITPGSFKEKIDALEKSLVSSALQSSHHNQAQAARLLGLSYHQFRYYFRKYGFDQKA